MNKLIVCFAPSDTTSMRRALKKLPCSIDHWEVGQPFPPHVHIESALTAKRFAALLSKQVVVFKASSNPDKKRHQKEAAAGCGCGQGDKCRCYLDDRGRWVRNSHYTREFRNGDMSD
ncbi:MAG: hypothetical protein WCW31_05200 [Patescibacteria group bacterium]|jgi:hypothetical protein